MDISWDNALKRPNKVTNGYIKVVQNACYYGDFQKWKLIPTSDKCFFRIQCKNDEKVLDVQGGSLANDTPIILYSWHGRSNQLWILTEAPVR